MLISAANPGCSHCSRRREIINEDEGIDLTSLTNKVTSIVCGKATFVDLLKTDLNFAVTFQKKYNMKFISTAFVDIVKHVMGSDLLTE